MHWEHSTSSEEERLPGLVAMEPTLKRRRLSQKRPAPRMVPEGALAVVPQDAGDCRISREINACVFSVNFGARKVKLRILRPLRIEGRVTGTRRLTLQALAGKECGTVY